MEDIITVSVEAGMGLLKILKMEPECYSCNTAITEANFGVFYNNPNRVFCNNIFCINEALST